MNLLAENARRSAAVALCSSSEKPVVVVMRPIYELLRKTRVLERLSQEAHVILSSMQVSTSDCIVSCANKWHSLSKELASARSKVVRESSNRPTEETLAP